MLRSEHTLYFFYNSYLALRSSVRMANSPQSKESRNTSMMSLCEYMSLILRRPTIHERLRRGFLSLPRLLFLLLLVLHYFVVNVILFYLSLRSPLQHDGTIVVFLPSRS